jgi:hypothetical protein
MDENYIVTLGQNEFSSLGLKEINYTQYILYYEMWEIDKQK